MRLGHQAVEGVAGDQWFARNPGHQITDVGGEVFGVFVGVGVERKSRLAVRARRAAEAEIDAPGRQGVEHAELFGDFQRRIVRQHDPGAADADACGCLGDRRHDDFRRRADYGRVVVVFRNPEPLVAEFLAVFGQRHGVADGLRLRHTGGGGRLIENGKLDHQPAASASSNAFLTWRMLSSAAGMPQ